MSGKGFMAECRDVIVCEVGKECPPPEPSPPATGIHMQLVQGSKVWDLGTVDARSDYTFSIPVRVPSDAAAGAATVRAVGGITSGAETRLQIVGRSRPSELPRTGPEVIPLAIALIGLVLLGAVLRGREKKSPAR